MNVNDLANSLDEQNNDKQQAQDKAAQLQSVNASGEKVAKAVEKGTQETVSKLDNIGGAVKITNPDLAKSQDMQQVVEAINQANLTTFMQTKGLPELAQNLTDLSSKTQDLQDRMENEGLNKMSSQLGEVVKKLDSVAKTLSKTEVSMDTKLQKTIENLSKSIGSIDFNPSVNVAAPETKVVTTPVDLKPVISALDRVEKACSTMEMPDNTVDIGPILVGLQGVQDTIASLKFPASNYVLPFRTYQGKATQLQLDSLGKLPISGLVPGNDYDYLDVQQTDSDTETYLFKTGGSGGSTVRTIVVNYTSATKSDIDNVSWS